MQDDRYDLEERLLEYAARIVRFAEVLPQSAAGRHVCRQLLRCGTSPMAQHGEAQGAESRRDFVHKFQIGLKELRETQCWLRLSQRVPLVEKNEQLASLIRESDQLVRIFATSVKTAKSKMPRPKVLT